jgi:putative ABC transport system ATP-binding protein
MKLVRELVKKYLGRGIILLAMAIASTLLGLLIIELGRRIINLISSSGPGIRGDYRLLVIYCFLMLFIILVGGSIGYLIGVLFTRLSQSVLRDIRLKLFDHILKLPQEFHNQNPVGLIMSRMMNDVEYIGQFLSRALLLPIMNIVMIGFYAVYIFYLNWKLAIAGMITLPFMAMVLPKFNRRLGQLSEEYSNSMGNMSSYFQEVFSGIGDVRSNQTYFFEESRLKTRIKEFFDINQKLAITSGRLDFLLKLITQAGPLLIYLYGGLLCIKGELAVGTLVATIAVIHNLYHPVDSLVTFLQEWRQVKVRFDKLDEYLQLKPEDEILPGKEIRTIPTGEIRFDHVQFGFDKEILLKDINFRANPGKGAAFVGTSGSGKSLTAALINRIYQPLSGKVTLGEKDIDSIRLYDLRSQIGYVSQTPFLFNDTIKKNILYALLRKKGGQSDRLEEWVDFSMLNDINNLERLDHEIIKVVKDVGLFDDLYELGLRSKLNEGHRKNMADDKGKIIEARRLFFKGMANPALQYIEHFQEDRFLEYCTLFENIVFCPSALITEEFGSIKEFCRKNLNEQLKHHGLLETFFKIGIHLVREDASLLEGLYKKRSPLLGYLGLRRDEIENKVKVSERVILVKEDPLRMDRMDPSLVGDILALAYDHIPGKSKENLLDDGIKKHIVEARKSFKENLPKEIKEKVKFFNMEEYLEPLSLRENIIFGNINPFRKRANESINALIKKVVNEAGIEDLVLKLGLEFNVGERGNKLSGGQKQKVAIARILLKNPYILILDEATASLDAASQARITELIRDKFKDKTVISIAHRLNTIRDYDKILVFDKGQIVEQGTFEELMNADGLFKKLFHESN